MQYFKGDAKELKFYESGKPIMDILSGAKDEFFDGAYSCFLLGELLYDTDRAPLANAIDREIFRELFATVFNAFIVAGTFESYVSVFKNIFGDDVVVEFTVPAAGKLEIEIQATGILFADRLSREIIDGAYEYSDRITTDADTRVARIPKGFETEYEAQQMLFELVPAGIYTTISLTIA